MAYCNTYSGLGAGFTNVMQAVANTARQIAQTATNTKNNQNPNPAAQIATQSITGGQVVVAQRAAQQAATLPPATTPTITIPTQDTKPAKTWKDYLVWIALGGVVAFGAYKMLTGKKKRR